MAYPLISESTLSDGAVSSIEISMPVGHKAGDITIFAITVDETVSTAIPVPVGLIQIGTQATSGQAVRVTGFARQHTAENEAAVTFTGELEDWIVTTHLLRGATALSIQGYSQVNSANSTSNSLTSGTITTTSANALIFYIFGYDGGNKLIPDATGLNSTVLLSKNVNNATQIVGYSVKRTAGATTAITALSEVASEGGSALVFAIVEATPATALLPPENKNQIEVVARYGGNISGATATTVAFNRHDSFFGTAVGFTAASIVPTVINGLTVASGTSVAYGGFTSPTNAWGNASILNLSASGVDNTGRWIPMTHSINTTNMVGKILHLQFATQSNLQMGTEGWALYLQDTSNNWVVYQISRRQSTVIAQDLNLYITIGVTTPLASSVVPINFTSVNKVGYLVHRVTTTTTARAIYVRDLYLLTPQVIVGGNVDSPITPVTVGTQLLENGTTLASTDLSDYTQSTYGITFGDGTTPTYLDFSGKMLTTKLPFAAGWTRRGYRVEPNATSAIRTIYLGANDVMNFTGCVWKSNVRQALNINPSSSNLGSISFAGAVLSNWNITNNVSGIDINGATIDTCEGTLNGGGLNGCTISKSTSSFKTNNPANFTGNTFNFSLGHAIEITVAGTYAFESNVFNGYGLDGTTNAAVYNNSGGVVNLQILGSDQIPTIRNGAGSTTNIQLPATVTIDIPNNNQVQMRRNSDNVVLLSRNGSGTMNVASYIGQVVYFVRVNLGRDIASTSPTTYTIVGGDNGIISLYVGAEVQIANAEKIQADLNVINENVKTSSKFKTAKLNLT